MTKNLYEFIFNEKMIGDYEQSRSTGLNPSYSSMSPGFFQHIHYNDEDTNETTAQPEHQNE